MGTISQYPESTLTERGQTTIPSEIRRNLNLQKSDKIRFVREGDRVYLERVEEEDPAMASFLSLISSDIEKNPHNVQPLTSERLKQLQTLVEGVDVDLDAPLDET